MNEQGMRIAIVSWLKSLYTTPPPVIYDFQAFPETGPWISFKIGTVTSKGYDSQLGMDNTYQMHFGGVRQATITISYFGYQPKDGTALTALDYPMQNAQLISSSLERTNIQQALSAAGFNYLHKNPVVNLTYLLESKYQPRADFDFYLGFVETEVEDDGYIATAKITGDVDVGGQIIHVEELVGDPLPP